jgi:hypothetical protein
MGNVYLHPQNPEFDLMCVPTVMHANKCKASKMAGAGLLQLALCL